MAGMFFAVLSTMSCLSGQTLSRSTDPDRVAIIARIYTSPNSHQKSRFHLYLCGIDGTHRHVLPEATGRLIDVRWIDRNHLAWVSRGDGEKFVEKQMDLHTRRVKIQTLAGIPVSYWAAGSGQFKRDVDHFDSVDKDHPGSFGEHTPNPDWVYKSDGKEKVITAEDCSPHGMVFDPKTNGLWFCNWNHNSTLGTYTSVFKFDWKTKEPKKLFSDASEFDFQPGRALYLAVATRKLADYADKKSLWVAKAWAGNLDTGKTWDLIGGMAYATSIALRPGVN